MDRPAQWALVGAAWFLAASVAVFGYLTWQRLGRVPMASGAAASADPSYAICPVTGARVLVGPATPKVVYMGHTFYFSGAVDSDGLDARSRFLMDPEAWLKHRNAGGRP